METNPEQVPGLIPMSDDEVDGEADVNFPSAQYCENQYMSAARQAFDEKQYVCG